MIRILYYSPAFICTYQMVAKVTFKIILTYIFLTGLLQAKERVIPINQARSFVNDVVKNMNYFRIEFDDRALSLSETDNGNTIFTLPINSRRNNFEEVIILSYGCIGRAIKYQLDKAVKDGKKVIVPSIVTIECYIPMGRNNTYLVSSLNNKILVQFVDGTITAEQIWREINNTFESSTHFPMTSRTPEIFMTDVDFENMISARIALEGKNSPNLSTILSLASKASWVPGLEGQIEGMLVDHLRENHLVLMTDVMGTVPTESQMVRIGKQFFFHVQKPVDEITATHTKDSLRYVWKGNTYPEALDKYYIEYRLKHGL